MDDPVSIMRMIERIIAVIIGGISIYLGYRLFFHLPFENNHEGTLQLPGVKIILSRVGPGVFFAAFGSIVLFYSITTQVVIEDNDRKVAIGEMSEQPSGNENIHNKKFTGISSGPQVSPQQLSKALTSIEMLNCAQRILAKEKSSRDLNNQFSVAIRESKRALLLSVWDENDWGPTDQLKTTGLATDAPLLLRNMFDATYGECPK